ncbi:AAA family ATPase [Saccharolobus islandicus]|uniref:ATPase n=2 Tax=Saccharolobus islandicus TaxID=43080 RepID=C3MV44_SACI4|nr:ATP-binding protein [Sulfolobus islandicus]ACP37407.1 ATPase [Sulfolobus islandicus M.14.25]
MRLHLRRREEKKIASIKNWTLIYGRRKTGKTTLVKSALKYDTYIIIGDVNNAITQSDEIVRIEKALEEVKRTLKNGGIAVIDEFQRLPEIYWSLIASWAPSGILVAIGSSYGIVNKVFDRNSPLLGIFTPLEIGLISYEDVLSQLNDPVLSVLYRDPWIIPFIESYDELKKRIKEFSLVAKGLIGEVFKEEERQLTDLYYKILLTLGEGVWRSKEIAGIVQREEPTITSMINKLAKMGLVSKILTLGKENYYKVSSPPLSLILYAESKYMVSERDALIEELPIGREVQFSIGEMLAKYFGGQLYYSPKEDIDVVIVRKKKPIWAFEIKMGEITKSEALNSIKRMSKVSERVGFVSLKEKPNDYGDLNLGPKELMQIAKELSS